MKKSILSLKGVKALRNSDLQKITGGIDCWKVWDYCAASGSGRDYFDRCMRNLACADDPEQ
ncbi:hypothetical protein ACOSP6_05160 [Tenacibaculum sp. MEBiC06402]|uniref:hypothetical protein n=1 Tax=unclassified Tenacibaculum TaxID=2635139 RepID=UPI003B9A74BC